METDGQSDLRERTLDFALEAVELAADLREDATVRHLAEQMMRAATSVGAHFREASRARSSSEFVSKLDVALQELEEVRYWLELLERSDSGPQPRLRRLAEESSELNAIITSIVVDLKTRGD